MAELNDISDQLDEDEVIDLEEALSRRLDRLGLSEDDEISECQKNVAIWTEYFSPNITVGRSDQEFLVKSPWTEVDRREFQRLHKVPLSVNKLYDSVKKNVGEMRKNRPDLMVRSLNGKASQDEINLRQDFLRTLSCASQTDLIYQQMLMSSMSLGFGAFKVGLEYESPHSFNKVVRFGMIKDPTLTFFDPIAEMPHKGDGNFCAVAYILSREEFYAIYPHIGDVESFDLLNNVNMYLYNPKKSIVVMEYTKKVWFPTMLYKLSTGEAVTKTQWESMQPIIKQQYEMAESSTAARETILNMIPKVVAKRPSKDYKTITLRMIKNRIVEAGRFPSKYLPVIFCSGDSHYINGQECTRSYIRDSVDAQRALNYEFSEMVAEVKNRRREQWLGTPDNVRGHEHMWYNPEVQQGILLAEPDRKTQQMPIKMPAWEPSQGLLAQYQQTTMDLRELTGFMGEMAGQPTNAISGTAIARRQYGGSMSAFIFEDNWHQAIAQGGRVALDLFPVAIGSDERRMVLQQANGDTRNVTFNQRSPNSQKISNQVLPGEYDVEIDCGPSFPVQQESAMNLLMQLATSNPQVFPLVADLIAKNMDIQYMPQIVKRLETLVPPNVLAAEKGEPPPPPPPNPQDELMKSTIAEQQSKVQLNQANAAKAMAQAQHASEVAQTQAEEVQLRKQDQAIKIAALQQQGAEFVHRTQSAQRKNALDAQTAAMDYEKDMAKTMVDLHKHHNPVEKTTNSER